MPSRRDREIRSQEDRNDLTERCVAQAWDSLHAKIKQWIPEDVLLTELSASVTDVLNQVGDEEFAAGFRTAMPVPGAAQEDYEPRILELEDSGVLVAGIRFRLDPSFSFVEVYARGRPIRSARTLMATVDHVRHMFRVFSPRYLRLHVAAGSTEDRVVQGAPGRTDFVTVAGSVAALQAQRPPSNMERIHLELATSTVFYDRYLIEYEAFHEAVPELRDLVPVASREALERSRTQGLLYEAYVDGEWSGIIAGRQQADYGMRGYRIIEEVLSSRFRGSGLGPALQRHFIDALPAEDHQVLHGAIDPSNLPSLATAKRVGRTEVMHTYFIVLT